MFSSFDAFKATLDSPDTHWAIDVYTPPDAEYRKIHDWASQLHTRGYQLGKMSDLARKIFRDVLIDASDTTSDLSVFFTPTGTAANAMARAAVLDQLRGVHRLLSGGQPPHPRRGRDAEGASQARARRARNAVSSRPSQGHA